MKKVYAVILIFLFGFICQACSGKNIPKSESSAPQIAEAQVAEAQNMLTNSKVAYDNGMNGFDEDALYGMGNTGEVAASTSAPATESGVIPEQNDKIIKTCDISLDSGNYVDAVNEIRRLVDSSNGYIESSNSYSRTNGARELRYFNATLKIPANHYESVKTSIESLGRVRNVNENASNVSAQYYDIESRMRSKKIEEERLLDMISKAETIKELLALEDRLTQVRTNIEQYQTSLSGMDRQVAYSTINISLNETDDESITEIPDNLSGRIKASFIKSVNFTIRLLQEIIIFIVGIIIPLIIIVVLIIIGVAVYKRKKNKGENDNEEKHD